MLKIYFSVIVCSFPGYKKLAISWPLLKWQLNCIAFKLGLANHLERLNNLQAKLFISRRGISTSQTPHRNEYLTAMGSIAPEYSCNCTPELVSRLRASLKRSFVYTQGDKGYAQSIVRWSDAFENDAVSICIASIIQDFPDI